MHVQVYCCQNGSTNTIAGAAQNCPMPVTIMSCCLESLTRRPAGVVLCGDVLPFSPSCINLGAGAAADWRGAGYNCCFSCASAGWAVWIGQCIVAELLVTACPMLYVVLVHSISTAAVSTAVLLFSGSLVARSQQRPWDESWPQKLQ